MTPNGKKQRLESKRRRTLKPRMSQQASNLRILRGCVYGLALFLLVLILLVQAFQCLRLWYVEPTYFSSAVVRQEAAAFPSFTVCPEGGGYNEEIIQVCMTVIIMIL